jgi:hypothetical protein
MRLLVLYFDSTPCCWRWDWRQRQKSWLVGCCVYKICVARYSAFSGRLWPFLRRRRAHTRTSIKNRPTPIIGHKSLHLRHEDTIKTLRPCILRRDNGLGLFFALSTPSLNARRDNFLLCYNCSCCVVDGFGGKSQVCCKCGPVSNPTFSAESGFSFAPPVKGGTRCTASPACRKSVKITALVKKMLRR